MKDFRRETVYQIYPKSFNDSNGDGIGDIRGITEKLDYIESLGAGLVWLTPFYSSPQNDNGYDVADYCSVDPIYGTMEDVDELIAEAGKHGIGLMLDMVFNHTSTEHEWFRKALEGDERYQKYYIFREGTPDNPPTNWLSKFGGSAWEWAPEIGKWYLHLFDRTQADLNWDNPEVRKELQKVLLFWKDKGIRAFRFDVVNLISKPEVFEDDTEGDGRRFYTDGPHIHEYLKEMVASAGLTDSVTVGEMSSTNLSDCIMYSNPDERELSMCFSFHHLKTDYQDGDKWRLGENNLDELKRLLSTWQEGMQEGNGWNALFWCNHDQPRIVSRMGSEGRYWRESAKALATCIHLMRGTPYVYQGEELGMMNAHYPTISSYRDVESLNYYKIMLEEGRSEDEALEVLSARSRDNARTPMQWNRSENMGFTSGTPWLSIPDNPQDINAEDEVGDEGSVLCCYRKLIRLRRDLDVVAEGDIRFLPSPYGVMLYERRLDGKVLSVAVNLLEEEALLPEALDGKLVIGSYEDSPLDGTSTLRPFEAVAYLN